MFKYLTLLFTSILFAQTYPGDDVVRQGVRAFYNYETEEAIEILAQARNDSPENPTVHLTWAAARWLHNQANSSVEQTYIDLENDLNEVIPVYAALMVKYPHDPSYQLYLGSAKGLMARIYLGKKEWLNTLEWAYAGFRVIQKVEAEHPVIIDATLSIVSVVVMDWIRRG